MMNRKVFLKTIYWIVVVGIFLFVNEGFAANSNAAFDKALNSMEDTFQKARGVVYYVAGFGLIGVAVAAIMGKINFKWLAMICIALATLAGAEKIRDYATHPVKITDPDYTVITDDNDFDLRLNWDNTSDDG